MKKSPMGQVKDNFGDRKSLVAELAKLVDKQHGDSSNDDVKSRLMGLSNAKLLRLYRVEQDVREQFGDRAKLEAAIVEARKEAGLTADDDFKTKLGTYTKAQLVDMTNRRIGGKKLSSTVAKPKPKKKAAPAEAAPATSKKKAATKKADTKKAPAKKATSKKAAGKKAAAKKAAVKRTTARDAGIPAKKTKKKKK